MNKSLKVIFSGIISIIITYYVYSFILVIKFKHSTEFNNYTRYLWVFNDSAKKYIDPMYAVGDVRKSDVLYHYNYKNNFYIMVWEFNDVVINDLRSIPINQNVFMNKFKLTSGEQLHGIPEISVKSKLPFNEFMSVNLNEKSKIISDIEGVNYKGFFGSINKLSLQNREGEHLIMFDYQNKIEPTLFLFYRKSGRFFLIMVNSKYAFDENIINIFNLSCLSPLNDWTN